MIRCSLKVQSKTAGSRYICASNIMNFRQSINRQGRNRQGLSVLIVSSHCVLSVITTSANAGAPPGVIADRVDIGHYRHCMEDLLYTRLGDNRGFGPEHDLARDNILADFMLYGFDAELDPFQYNGTTYHNVVATLTGYEHPDEIIVVGAHFDSANNPGADDNGSGSAVVMETARLFSGMRSARTIKFVCFDREEQGKRGSVAFVADHADANIVLAVTTDMVGHNSGAYGMDIYSKNASAAAANGIATAIDTYGNGLSAFLNFGNFSFSDHWSFESVGIPAFVVIERCYLCNGFYHTQNDAIDVSPDYIDFDMLKDLLRSVAGYVAEQADVSLYGDANDDGDIDFGDFAIFQLCMGGDVSVDCRPFDADGDGATTLSDFASFGAAYTGPR